MLNHAAEILNLKSDQERQEQEQDHQTSTNLKRPPPVLVQSWECGPFCHFTFPPSLPVLPLVCSYAFYGIVVTLCQTCCLLSTVDCVMFCTFSGFHHKSIQLFTLSHCLICFYDLGPLFAPWSCIGTLSYCLMFLWPWTSVCTLIMHRKQRKSLSMLIICFSKAISFGVNTVTYGKICLSKELSRDAL